MYIIKLFKKINKLLDEKTKINAIKLTFALIFSSIFEIQLRNASNKYSTVIVTIQSIIKCTTQRLIHIFTQSYCRQLHGTCSNCEQL